MKSKLCSNWTKYLQWINSVLPGCLFLVTINLSNYSKRERERESYHHGKVNLRSHFSIGSPYQCHVYISITEQTAWHSGLHQQTNTPGDKILLVNSEYRNILLIVKCSILLSVHQYLIWIILSCKLSTDNQNMHIPVLV